MAEPRGLLHQSYVRGNYKEDEANLPTTTPKVRCGFTMPTGGKGRPVEYRWKPDVDQPELQARIVIQDVKLAVNMPCSIHQ